MGEMVGSGSMKLRGRGGLTAAAVAVVAAGLMLTNFALDENSYQTLAALPTPTVVTGLGHPEGEHQININTATAEELDELPGIGPVKAAAIVAWRDEHGAFRYPEELILVPGIGEKTLLRFLDQITVGGG